MALQDELERIAAAVQVHATPGEAVAGILAAEPLPGARWYLVAYSSGAERSWLVVDPASVPATRRETVRETASIVALCELAEESAGGGELEELRRQLVSLRVTENPPGIERAEAAALALEQAIGSTPRIASPAWLDAVGAAVRELEVALGGQGPSPFAEAMKGTVPTVEAFAAEVEERYRLDLG